MKIVLFSKTFKGYLRAYNKRSGEQIVGMEFKFVPEKERATLFANEKDKKHFIDRFCMGVNYDFKEEFI